MMSEYFPILDSVRHDSDLIINALNKRTEEVRSEFKNQGFLRKITNTALRLFGLISIFASFAALPAAAITFSVSYLIQAAIGFCVGVTSLAIYVLMNSRSPDEAIIKDCWKGLFDALRNGNGDEILDAAQALFNQKKRLPQVFDKCMYDLKADDLTPFFHKMCAIAFMLKAIGNVRAENETALQTNAHKAFIHFEPSGLPKRFGDIVQLLMQNHENIRQLILQKQIGDRDIRSIDYLIFLVYNPEEAAA